VTAGAGAAISGSTPASGGRFNIDVTVVAGAAAVAKAQQCQGEPLGDNK